eukprot:TRINITY_DN8505_c2_g1_i1.p2 TRINITY_DN8505_c2_g1~~TRINITY_DN8505_c2_g1_i1.p2  ORF type:complete len:188 (-),score=17.89 TRINITY_DN8505_c2_g1_i1:68-631(-)
MIRTVALLFVAGFAVCFPFVSVSGQDWDMGTPTATGTPVVTAEPASASPSSSPFPRAGVYPMLVLTFTGVTVDQVNGLVNVLADIIEFAEDLIRIYVSSMSTSTTTVVSAVFLETTASDRQSMKRFASDQSEQDDLTDALGLPRGCLKVRYVGIGDTASTTSPDNFDDSSAASTGSFAVAWHRWLMC